MGAYYDIKYSGTGEIESLVPGCYDYQTRMRCFSVGGTIAVLAGSEEEARRVALAELEESYRISDFDLVVSLADDQTDAEESYEGVAEVLDFIEEYNYID